MPVSSANMLLEKSIKVFLNFLDWNTTNIVKDIFIFPTEDIQKKITPGCEKVLTLQKPVCVCVCVCACVCVFSFNV